MPLSTLRVTPRDVIHKTRGQDGFALSFPVGLLHPLQHAGLTRRFSDNPHVNRYRVRWMVGLSRYAVTRQQIPSTPARYNHTSLMPLTRGTWLGPYETKPVRPTGRRRHGKRIKPALARAGDDQAGVSVETKGAGRGADLLVTTRQLSRSRYCFTKSQPTSVSPKRSAPPGSKRSLGPLTSRPEAVETPSLPCC